MTSRALAATSLAALVLLATPAPSRAFCGFYVGGAGSSLYANATMVVLLRDGNRTVLSMQNDYQGPPEDFAMVIPVPVVLHEDDVRTLPRELFQRIDTLAAPRLVEYWEHDPCSVSYPEEVYALTARVAVEDSESPSGGGEDLQVRIEARFAVAEYDVVVLSAGDSAGLETWRRMWASASFVPYAST